MDISCSSLSCTKTKEISAIKVLAFGNMLINYTAKLQDTKVLDRHRLSLNTKVEMDMNTFSNITSDLNVEEGLQVELGGSALKTSEYLRKLGTETLFFSACGDDPESQIISALMKKNDIDRSYFRVEIINNAPTGRRISLCHNDARALYTSHGASSQFSVNYLRFVLNEEDSTVLRPENRVQIFYVEGFFVPNRESVTTYIVRNYIKGRRYLALNLCSEQIVRSYFPHLLYMVNNALLVFGSQREYDVFCECWGALNIRDLAEGLVKKKESPIIFVINKGSEGVDLISNYFREGCAPGPLTFQSFRMPYSEEAEDLKGTSDVFVAGFLHAWLEKRELSQCVRIGCFYAIHGITATPRSKSYDATL
ncbi:adenosine kinase-like [Haematobia irritans]|uniref:adenosine kinase-like n=1 Tax=Haematobia irritans TaxID=7368 RepID=UPI003F4FD486